jgi:Enoyl-CoA hydratase/carnithine racemase
MTYDTIKLARDQGLATLTLNAPDKLNAVSRKMIAEIKQAWAEIGADGSVRAVLLTGSGRGFCAGADLSDPDRKNDADSGSALDKFFNPVIRTMRALPKPIVAAVNGVAAGVGMSFAMAADITIAAKSASFLQAFSRIGLLPMAAALGSCRAWSASSGRGRWPCWRRRSRLSRPSNGA